MTRFLNLPLPFIAAMMLFAYMAFALLREAWRYDRSKQRRPQPQSRKTFEEAFGDLDDTMASGYRRKGGSKR